jgi:hypothetical protein
MAYLDGRLDVETEFRRNSRGNGQSAGSRSACTATEDCGRAGGEAARARGDGEGGRRRGREVAGREGGRQRGVTFLAKIMQLRFLLFFSP